MHNGKSPRRESRGVQGRRPPHGYCRINRLIARYLCSQSVRTLVKDGTCRNVDRPFNCGRSSSTVLKLSDSTTAALARRSRLVAEAGRARTVDFVFHPASESRRVDAIAGVMVLSEVVTTTVPADIAGPVNRVRSS
jgi:hypothetical protein